MIVKIPGSQKGSPAAADEGEEGRRGGRARGGGGREMSHSRGNFASRDLLYPLSTF